MKLCTITEKDQLLSFLHLCLSYPIIYFHANYAFVLSVKICMVTIIEPIFSVMFMKFDYINPVFKTQINNIVLLFDLFYY